jgi:hypothetical protein
MWLKRNQQLIQHTQVLAHDPDCKPMTTRRKVPIFDWSLRLFSSRWRHLRLKVCVVALDKSHASLVVGDNGVDGNCSVQIPIHDKIRVYVCGASIQQLFWLYIWTVRFYS